MFECGLLILTQPLQRVRAQLPSYLSEISEVIRSKLYVHIQPYSAKSNTFDLSKFVVAAVPNTCSVSHFVKEFYSSSAGLCSSLDVTILLGNITNGPLQQCSYNLKKKIDVILIDQTEQTFTHENLPKEFLENFRINFGSSIIAPEVKYLNIDIKKTDERETDPSDEEVTKTYNNVALGGTFDHIHPGHKILLSESCLLCDQTLTVAITAPCMNLKKTLFEMIQPSDKRIKDTEEFLLEVKPSLKYEVLLMEDVLGPLGFRNDFDAGIVSQETKKGGDRVNEIRQQKNLKKLHLHVVELIADPCRNDFEENKISSSSLRKRKLGTLVHPIKANPDIPSKPYIVGLTGGIASGKSSVAKRLEQLGAAIVDCDKLGHDAYVKGSPGFDKVVGEFGSDIVGEDGEVDRKALGSIVFADKGRLEKLNSLVWPEIGRLVEENMRKFREAGQAVVVLDAAVMLEAGWDNLVHEVWTTIVPPEEAIKRMQERNKLSEEDAKKRLESQIPNEVRVERSNVVLCTLWAYEYTQMQVEKAWNLLLQRIKISKCH